MKPDERNFLDELQRRTREMKANPVLLPPDKQFLGLTHRDMPYVRELARELGMNEKRAAYLTQKWTDRGWYDYGCHCLAGWLTEEGLSA